MALEPHHTPLGRLCRIDILAQRPKTDRGDGMILRGMIVFTAADETSGLQGIVSQTHSSRFKDSVPHEDVMSLRGQHLSQGRDTTVCASFIYKSCDAFIVAVLSEESRLLSRRSCYPPQPFRRETLAAKV